jgi:hypothetical protein
MVEITCKITDEFSSELDTILKEFTLLGIKTTREELATKFMMVGHLNELRERGKLDYAEEE